jgi:hypothetical protein
MDSCYGTYGTTLGSLRTGESKKSVESRRCAVSRTASMLLLYFDVHGEPVTSVRDGLLGPGERKFRRGRELIRVGLRSRHRVNVTH